MNHGRNLITAEIQREAHPISAQQEKFSPNKQHNANTTEGFEPRKQTESRKHKMAPKSKRKTEGRSN